MAQETKSALDATVASASGAEPGERAKREASASLEGRTLSARYRVTRRLAEGGMGVVYEAEDELRHRKVAVKTLHAYLANDEDIEARFRREAHALEAISHPNVIEVYDAGTLEDGARYLVLELLLGRDLARVLQADGPMEVGRVARVLHAIAEGVAVAHDKGIIHRDLKPENVFLVDETRGSERVKVMDFGVARYRAAPIDARTRTGATVGTPYYMAPEQAQGRKEIDRRADIYALGVMGFRMLTGHHPFDDDSYPMLVVKICTEPPPSIGIWRRDVPPEFELLLDRMMSKEASSRPSTMRDVAEALAPFMGLERPVELTDAPAPARALPAVIDGVSGFDRTRPATPADGNGAAAPDAHHDEDEAASLAPRRGSAPLVLGGLVVVVAALVAWASLGREPPSEPEEEPDTIALPEPAPPRTRALGADDDRAGWAFLNPLPRVMPQWNAVAAAGPDLVAMVGANGLAARFRDRELRTWPTGTRASLFGVAWTGAEDATAVGEDGAIVRLSAQGPSLVSSGLTTTLRAVAALSATEQLAVGDEGVILRLLGDRVLPIPVEGTPDLFAIDVRGGVATIVGEAGTLIEVRDGRAIRLAPPSVQTLRAVGGCEGSLYVAGDEGTLLRRTREGFRPVALEPATRAMFTSIGCDRGRTVVVGAGGEVRLVSGRRSVQLASGFDGVFTGVSGARDEATWIVGSSGRLAVVVSDHLETRVSGPIASLRDVADIGGALVAVGDWGKLIRQREAGFELDPSPTESALGAVASLGDGSLLAVGDDGAMVRIRFEGAELVDSHTSAGLRGVVAEEGHFLAVGTGGTVLRGTPSAIAVTRVPDVENLAGLTGTPSDALAVGDGGVVVRFTREGTRVTRCERALSLRAVVREDPSGPAWAVGEAGALVRIDPDGSCVAEEALGTATLNGIGRGPDGRPLAVGDLGVAFARTDDGAWRPVDLDVGIVSLRAVRSIDRWVIVVGAGGVILRHIRVDGG